MSKIIISISHIDTQSGFDMPTRADITFQVNDHPKNVNRHLHLLGLLAECKLVLSDDDGKFTVQIQEKEKEK